MSLWEEVKRNLIDLYSVTSDKTVEVARISSRKYEKFGISRDIERQFSELGNLVFSAIKENRGESLHNDEAILALVDGISRLEIDLKTKDEEINNIRNEAAPPRAKAAAAGSAEDFEATNEEAAASNEPAETIITDPILQEGGEDSAILMDAGSGEDMATAPETQDIEGEEAISENPKNNPKN